MTTPSALAVTSGVGTGFIGWFLRNLLDPNTFDSCQPLIASALDSVQGTCTCPAVKSIDWEQLLTLIASDKVYILLLGICIGLSASLGIDLLYAFKCVWRRQITRWISGKSPRVPRGELIVPVRDAHQGYSSH